MTYEKALELLNAKQNRKNHFTNISEADIQKVMNVNPICDECKKLLNGCNGTAHKHYTGCIYRKI